MNFLLGSFTLLPAGAQMKSRAFGSASSTRVYQKRNCFSLPILPLPPHRFLTTGSDKNRRPAAAAATSARVGTLRVLTCASPLGMSAILKAGFPLVQECAHAFLLVGGGEHGVEHAALEADALGERGLVGAVDAFLRHHRDGQRHGGDGLGGFQGLVQ